MQSLSHACSFSVSLSCTHALSHTLTPFLMPLLMTPPHFLQPCALSCGLALILSRALAYDFSCHLSPHAISFQHTVFIHNICLRFLESLLSHTLLSFFPSIFSFHLLVCTSSHACSFSHIFTSFLAASHNTVIFFASVCPFLQPCTPTASHPFLQSHIQSVSQSHACFLRHTVFLALCLTLSTSLSHVLSHSLFLVHSLHPFLACSSPHPLSPVLPFFYTLMLSCALPFSNALTFSLFSALAFSHISTHIAPFPLLSLVSTLSPTLTIRPLFSV